MAKVIDNSELPYRGRYPWHLWFNGELWELTRGLDFRCTLNAFQVNAYRTARRKGGIVRTEIEGQKVRLQFIRSSEADRSPAQSSE